MGIRSKLNYESGKLVEQLHRDMVDSPGNIQDYAGQDSEPPDLIEGVLAHCGGLDQVIFKGPV